MSDTESEKMSSFEEEPETATSESVVIYELKSRLDGLEERIESLENSVTSSGGRKRKTNTKKARRARKSKKSRKHQ